MELGEEEEEEEERGGGGSEGSPEEPSTLEDRCVMVGGPAPQSLGWAGQAGAPLPDLKAPVCHPPPGFP